MPHAPGKFCIDRNMVRWSLLQGIITRKSSQNSTTEGQDLPVRDITAIERTTATTVERLPFGPTMVLVSIALLLLAWWSELLPVRVVVGLAGLALLYSGTGRMRPRMVRHDAYQIAAPGLKREDWLVVGSTPEVIGFIEAVKTELGDETKVLGA